MTDIPVMPPDKVFLNPKVPIGQMRVWEMLYGFKGFRLPEKGGIEADYVGRPKPYKGLVYPEAVEANNRIKRFIVFFIKMLVPRRNWLETALTQFHRMCEYQYHPHYLHGRYYNDCCREMMGFVFRLLRRLGFSFDLSYELGRDIATLLEYENGYLFRVEDLFTETSKEMLYDNPREAIKGLAYIYSKREQYKGEGIETTFKASFKLIRFLLLIPKFKKAFRFALAGSDFKNFQLDETSKYWADRFDAYDFSGEPYKIRQLKQGFKLYGF